MLPIFFGIIAECAILVGFAFMLSRTMPNIARNKVCRCALFALCVPMNFVPDDGRP